MYINRERHRELIPYVVAVISVVEMFFLFLMIVHNNPFATFLTENPTDGAGLNPLLQNFYMVIHPPTMYLGFVGLTIPYAFGMAALITGYLDDSWLRAVRRWTMIAWLFLSFGLGLGMIWAYEELGWGGYWMWDPVENAGLLPWFTATAFLHSVMVQERRGMLRVWNVTLVITTFFLTIFGTFMTRSGVVQSVHAFGEDPELARLFTDLHGDDARGQLRLRDLPPAAAQGAQRARLVGVARSGVHGQQLDPAVLRVLRAVRHDVPDAQRGGDRPAHHRRRAVLQQLDGADRPDPAAADRHRAAAGVAQVHADEPARSVPVPDAWRPGGRRSSSWRSACRSGARGCASRSRGFVLGTIAQEFWRGARVRQQTTGTDLFTALVGLVGRNKRRYGGYIVHVGIVLMFLGFAGEGFKQNETVLLKPGQPVHGRRLHRAPDALKVTDDGRKQMVTAAVTVCGRRRARRRCIRRAGSSGSTRTSRRPKSRSAARSPRTSTWCWRTSTGEQSAERRGRGQAARELGVVRLRRAGARHAASRCCPRRRSPSRSRGCPAHAATATLLLLAFG